MPLPSRILVGWSLAALLLTGACSATQERRAAEQEDLGRGIVAGTAGARQEAARVAEGGRRVAGDVRAIEGAAYLLREFGGRERRVPVDENTTIDRPAHVGDKIEAVLDGSGRALRIRNIDDEYWRHE